MRSVRVDAWIVSKTVRRDVLVWLSRGVGIWQETWCSVAVCVKDVAGCLKSKLDHPERIICTVFYVGLVCGMGCWGVRRRLRRWEWFG